MNLKEYFIVECPHCLHDVAVKDNGDHECPFCGEDFEVLDENQGSAESHDGVCSEGEEEGGEPSDPDEG